MKRVSLIICSLLLSFAFIGNVNAEEYEVNENTGKYIVKDGSCSYTYVQEGFFGTSSNYGFEIVIKDDRLSDIASINGYDPIGNSYFNSLKYSSFFSNNSKEFSCPKKVYVNYLASPSGGAKQGYNLEIACDSETLGKQCHEATYIEGSGRKRYVIKDNTNPTVIKTKKLTCSYKKNMSSSGSTSYQTSAASSLIYNKYSDNSQNFYSNTNDTYSITGGSLSSCTDDMYVLISEDKQSYSIVNSCNANTNARCIAYRKESLASTVDSSLKDDGTTNNENASGVVDPGKIDSLQPATNVKFEEASCNTLLGDTTNKNDPAYYLDFAFNLVKYAAIIMLFILTIVEYAKAVASSNQDAIKKATQATAKRLIIAAIIFFLPVLINFILRLLGIISTNGTCGIGI